MTDKVAKIKVTKAERAILIGALHDVLLDGQHIAFVSCSAKPYEWKILISSGVMATEGEIVNISRTLAALLVRQGNDTILRGFKYDSPEILVKELQDLLGLKKSFVIDLL